MDLEVGGVAVALGVHQQIGGAVEGVEVELDLAFLAAEGAAAVDKAQLAQAVVEAQAGEIDLVDAVLEVFNHVERRHRGLFGIEIDEIVGEVIGIFAAPQMIRPQAAVQDIGAGVARQQVVLIVADDHIAPAAADGVLDDRPARDGDVLRAAADAGERAVVQIDHLLLAVAREVQRVVAAGVPHREVDRFAVVRRGGQEIAPGVGVEAVHRVAGAGAHVGAVQFLDRGDVIHHRAIAIHPFGVGAGVTGVEIAHDRVLQRILIIGGIVLVARVAQRRVIRSRVCQPQGMPQLVGEGLAAEVTANRRLMGGKVLVEPHRARKGVIAARFGTRRVIGVRVDGIRAAAGGGAAVGALGEVSEGDVRSVVDIGGRRLGKGHVRHVGPRLHRFQRLSLRRLGQRLQPLVAVTGLADAVQRTLRQEGIGQRDRLVIHLVAVVRQARPRQLIGGAIEAEVIADFTQIINRRPAALVAVQVSVVQREQRAVAQSVIGAAGLVIVKLIVVIVGGCGGQAGELIVILQNVVVATAHCILLLHSRNPLAL